MLDKSTVLRDKSAFQTCYISNMKVLEAGETTETRQSYRGSISSTSLNSKFFALSLPTLRSVVRQANEGVGVYFNHETYSSMQSGKSTRSYLREEKAITDFYILSDLEDTNSNDVIRRLNEAVVDALSIGFTGGDFMCDLCSEEMKYGYFYLYDENDHYLGQQLEKGKYITATVEGEVELDEFSVVGRGADPTAKIIKQLQDDLQSNKLSETGLLAMAEYHNLGLSQFKKTLGYGNPKSLLEGKSRRTTSLPPKPKQGEGNMAAPELNEETIQKLHDDLEFANNERERLETELAELQTESVSQSEHELIVQELAQLKASDPEGKMAEMVKQGEDALEYARSFCLEAFCAVQGKEIKDMVDDAEYIEYKNSLSTKTNFKKLMIDAKSDYARARTRRAGGKKSQSSSYTPLTRTEDKPFFSGVNGR